VALSYIESAARWTEVGKTGFSHPLIFKKSKSAAGKEVEIA